MFGVLGDGNEKSIFTVAKDSISKEMRDLMTSREVELTDQGMLTIPNHDSINLAERWVSEIYVWWDDTTVTILTKGDQWNWHQYGYNSQNKHFYNMGLFEEDAFAEIQALDIWPNSSAVAFEKTPKTLEDLLGNVLAVPSIEDLEEKIREVKALWSRPVLIADDPLTELKTANKELADMLEGFLEVPLNKIYAVHIGHDLEQEIVGIPISLEWGLSFEGRNSTSWLAKWQKIRFDDTGSQRLASKYK